MSCGGDDEPTQRRDPRTAPDTSTGTDTPNETNDTAPGPTDTSETITTPVLTMSQPVFEPLPSMVLGGWMRWTTEVPATSEVLVAGPGGRSFRVADPARVTEHELLVIGLHAGESATLTARSEADGLTASATLPFSTPPLPSFLPRVTLLTREAGMQPGWTLFNVNDTSDRLEPTALLVDEAGHPRWYHVHGDKPDRRGDVDVSLVPGPHILFGPSGNAVASGEVDLAGRLLWSGPPAEPPMRHHTLRKLDDGTYIGLQLDKREGIESDRIYQINAAGDEIWSWALLDHIPDPGPRGGDWSHCNSVFPGVEVDELVLGCRNISTVFGISHATGELLWTFGEHGDLAPDPDAAYPFSRFQHAPRRLPDGNLLLYDNAGRGGRSRALEVALDLMEGTTRVVWEFPGEAPVDAWYRDSWHFPIWGDADRLPDGNTLITAGTRQRNTQSRVFEVRPSGEVVWAIALPSSGSDVVGVYRAERIEPLVLDDTEPL